MNAAKGLFRPSEYFRPTELREALELLARYDGRAWPIAGGTDLMVDKEPEVEALVDVTHLGLGQILSEGAGVRMGAAASMADVGRSGVLEAGPWRILAEAAREVGTPQIRNVATIGGNLCRPSPCADMAPPLLALDAELAVSSTEGERRLPAAEFFRGVRLDALKPGELLTEIRLPALPERTGSAFLKKGRVRVGDLSVVSVAVRLSLDADGTCRGVRIALGAVAPVPVRAPRAEAVLEGKKPEDTNIERAAEEAASEIRPIDDVRASAQYRRDLSRVLVARAIREACRQAQPAARSRR